LAVFAPGSAEDEMASAVRMEEIFALVPGSGAAEGLRSTTRIGPKFDWACVVDTARVLKTAPTRANR